MRVSQKNVETFLAKKGVELLVRAPRWHVLYSSHFGYTSEGITYRERYSTIRVQGAHDEGGLLAEIIFSTARGHEMPALAIYR